MDSGNDLNNITKIYFDFSEVELQEKTYIDILDYNISINGSLIDGVFNSGTVLLSDNNPQSNLYAATSSVTINTITENTVDLDFSFTRNDGEVISGKYNGTYIIPN